MTTTIRPIVNLYECDGNAFAILARVRTAFREAGILDEWEAFRTELTAGDYDHLLGTIGTRCEVTWERVVHCDECGARVHEIDEGVCPSCGHEEEKDYCVECGQQFPGSQLNHNSQCCDCEWDAYYAEQDEDDENDEEDN